MSMNNQQYEAQKIRTRYEEKQTTDLDTLRELDAKVKTPPTVFASIFGSISAIIMGAGMSLVMTDIGSVIGMEDPLIPGIAIGLAGMFLALINYPIYKGLLNSRKKKYASTILQLSERIMKK